MPTSLPPSDLQQKLGAMRAAYASQLPAKLQQLDELWQQVVGESSSLGALGTIHFIAHGLAGSGATFGFDLLSKTARILEVFAKSLVQNQSLPTAEQQQQIVVLLAELRLAASQPDSGQAETETRQAPAAAAPAGPGRLIYLVEDDKMLAREMEFQLSQFGYRLVHLHCPEELAGKVSQERPAVILMDVNFPEGAYAGPQAVAGLPESARTIPVIFISAQGDLVARLRAVRTGGQAYVTKPVDIGSLVDRLDKMTTDIRPEPYRVMIVEDSPALAAFYAFTLQQAGMIVETVNDPMRMLEPLNEFKPELILMDMYMPEANGMELAQVIRQDERFVSTPIVFLSAETDPDKHFAALDLGVDDFLTKPIQPQHLVLSARSRVERARTLRSFMVRDSLTGLLNHTRTKEQLDIEFGRAQRHGHPLSFAMLDLDRFKSVNDTYGHPTGDCVIKSLARLLRQRLRQGDIIGRYGGEEFAVILTETDGPTALKVMDQIREDFAQIHQRSDSGVFSLTFSCGIATAPGPASAAELSAAADKALYEAKDAGRNRVVLAAGEVG